MLFDRLLSALRVPTSPLVSSSLIFSGDRNRRRRGAVAETERLEDRLVLSTINLVGTDLRINGTNQNDEIRTFHQGDKIRVQYRTNGGAWNYQTFRASVVDSIRMFGNGGNDVLDNDTIRPSVMWGGNGSDTIEGSSLVDTIHGGQGEDTIRGWGGNDVVYGGAGADVIYGNDGNDELHGEGGWNRVYGGNGNDRMFGGDKPDIMDGGNGEDFIRGWAGDDKIFAGGNNDTVYGDNGNDTIFATWGMNTLYGGNGNDRIQGGVGTDTIYGNAGNDHLDGYDGPDTVEGGDGNDRLRGGAGTDTLRGGSGNDGLFGGGHAGTSDLLNPGAGLDYVIDWQQSDGNLQERFAGFDANDAYIRFRNGRAYDTVTAGSWTDDEIAQVEDAFVRVIETAGHTRLLRRYNETSLVFTRHGQFTGSNAAADADSSSGEIRVYDGTFDLFSDNQFGQNDRTWAENVIVHELGHFRDEAYEWSGVTAFRAISNWTDDGNDNWTHSGTNDWASDYAKTDAYEDFAESFTAYIMRDQFMEVVLNSSQMTGATRDWVLGNTQTPTGKMASIRQLLIDIA